ncbi:hypothetical protein [Frankia sp. CcWB2]
MTVLPANTSEFSRAPARLGRLGELAVVAARCRSRAHSREGDLLVGIEGELCIAGPQLTPGYLDPADDRGRFFERDGRRWYRTGDRVRRRSEANSGAG